MLHKNVLEKFKELFPQQAERVVMWFPNGKNSIRLRTDYKCDYVFTYNAPYSWSYETIDIHVERMKGGSNM